MGGWVWPNKSLLTNEKSGGGRGRGGGGGELDGVCIVLAVIKDAKCQLSIQFVCPNIVCPSQIYTPIDPRWEAIDIKSSLQMNE